MIIFMIQVMKMTHSMKILLFMGDTMSIDTIDDDFFVPINYYDDHDWGDNYDASCDLENSFQTNDGSIVYHNICNTTKRWFGRPSTFGVNDPTILENYQSYETFDKSGFREVMHLVNVSPTIQGEFKIYMHVDHEENVLHESYCWEMLHGKQKNFYAHARSIHGDAYQREGESVYVPLQAVSGSVQ